ncbi:uncharacterized protein LOC120351185 [Nilaparvata lugens]|uniref:uncharacterized protein LOC120351185 n=1 Tax=Nilaparvata lugens TaxID=108931 RepID=UPI00193DC58C|nr:uncharacterized protein LOC120351185 [Nilaparvata lugens]
MDKFLKPDKFDGDPNSPTALQEWNFWLKTFENFIASFDEEDIDDESKLRLLTNFLSHSVYQTIADKNSYTSAIDALKSAYVKPINEIFARHKLATRKQSSDETIDQYNQALQQLSKNCGFADVDSETHRKTYIRDSFIRGLSSHQIRLRLLEFDKLTLDEAIEKARALESARNQSASYSSEITLNATSNNSSENSCKETNLSAVKTGSSSFQKCYFCGRQRHKTRQQCPALNDSCEKCQKIGHWKNVCKSTKTSSSSALIAASTVLENATVQAQVNNIPTSALIDTGSSETFISHCFAKKCGLEMYPTTGAVSMASTSLRKNIFFYCVAHLEFSGQHYPKTKFSVLPDLCANVIVGHDLLNQHSELRVLFGGTKPPLTINYLAPAKIEPPPLFEFLTKDIKPIITKSRKHSLED